MAAVVARSQELITARQRCPASRTAIPRSPWPYLLQEANNYLISGASCALSVRRLVVSEAANKALEAPEVIG